MSLEKPGQKKRGGVRKKSANPNQKKARRSDFEFPCLEPSVALLTRREEVEDVASYAHTLSREDKAWLNQFMSEYNEAKTDTAVFHKDDIVRDKNGEAILTTNRWGVIDENSVPLTGRKLCNDRNNARNRCWYTEEAAANRLNLVETEFELEAIMYGSQMEIEEFVESEEIEEPEDLE